MLLFTSFLTLIRTSKGTHLPMDTIQNQTSRQATIDYIRGTLVIAMILYHTVYCLVSFKLITIDLFQGFWWWFPRCIAAGFIFLSGMSLAAARSRSYTLQKALKRSGKLILYAGLVSLTTFVAFGYQYFVFFGILHLLAVSSIVAWPLAKPISNQGLQFAVAALGCAVLAAGLWLGMVRFDFPWLAWLGFRPKNLYPVDYEPLLPWFAWFIYGIASYKPFSTIAQHTGTGTNTHTCKETGAIASPYSAHPKKNTHAFFKPLLAALRWLGSHSLIIYLLHLPILYGLSWMLSLVLRKM